MNPQVGGGGNSNSAAELGTARDDTSHNTPIGVQLRWKYNKIKVLVIIILLQCVCTQE